MKRLLGSRPDFIGVGVGIGIGIDPDTDSDSDSERTSLMHHPATGRQRD